MSPVYCALVHHPVRDRQGATVTTAVTNLDVHDIARSARTFGVAGYFLVTPISAQRALIERIALHWREGAGRQRMPERAEALALCEVVADLGEVSERIRTREGESPWTIATAARPSAGRALVSHQALASEMRQREDPALILFGTGHGLTDAVLAGCDRQLRPLRGPGDYNHLSVRAAAAIVLDRLLGIRDDDT